MASSKSEYGDFLKKFCAGGVSGMAAKTMVAPLDRIKILLQGQNKHYQNLGVWSGIGKVVRTEGFWGLYKGNGAQMVRVFPYAAIQWSSFEMYNGLLSKYFNDKSQMYKLMTGAAAGINAVVLTYPLDLVRARLTFQVTPKVAQLTPGVAAVVQKRDTVMSTLISVAKNEGGMAGLYRGLTPAIIFILPYSGCNFYAFEKIKHTLITQATSYCAEVVNDEHVLNLQSKFLAGGVAGSFAATVAYPIDVCRRRMQLAYASEESKRFSKGFISTFILVYKENGIVKGLYRGITANYWRAAPLMAMNFASYEVLKQALGLKTGYKVSNS